VKKVEYLDLKRISYKDALAYQLEAQKALINRKLDIRERKISEDSELIHKLFFCEHTPVYTLGRSGSIDNLLYSDIDLDSKGIEFYKTNRGGDITYHGPGQIVGYPVFDLDEFYHDVHRYVRDIEEVIISTVSDFGIQSRRIDGLTGVWIEGKKGEADRKVCAIGVHISRWITLHGFALNVNTDLDYFQGIIPCGISTESKKVTSMQKEIGFQLDLDEVKKSLLNNFKEVFGVNFV